MRMKIKNWIITASVDDDKHLTLSVNNNDGSKVIILEADVCVNDLEWSDRFTTELTESEYNKIKN